MIHFLSTFWSVLTQILSVVSHSAQAAEDLAVTAQLHTSNLRLKTETELNHELEELRKNLALPAPKAKAAASK